MPYKSKKKYAIRKKAVIRLFRQNQVDQAYLELSQLLQTHPKDYELYYLAGMIHSSRDQYVEAMNMFEQALKINPRDDRSCFEIGLLQSKLCRFNKALGYLHKARDLGYNARETNSYLKQVRKLAGARDVRLSACLIVKNEEEYLPKCLKSIEAIVDEIVIVDTGSTDHTIEIAEKFGAKIFHFEWRDDFAAARNFANEQASGDWILQMDADEELFPEDQNKVREVIHQDECNGAYVALQNRVASTFGENLPSMHYLVRLFRNRKDFYFENPIHETLKISGKVIAVDINLLHHGYNLDPDYLREKRQRNREILYKRLEEDPDSLTTLFYLSMMHLGNREYDEVETFANRALEKIDPESKRYQHLYLMLLNNLAHLNLERKKYDSVTRYCQQAIETNANYLDPYYFLGMSYVHRGSLLQAREVFQKYLELEKKLTESPVFNLFGSSSKTYLFQVYHNLGKVYRKERNFDSAIEMFTKAVDINPKFWIGLVDLGYLYLEMKDWQSAADFLDRAISMAKKNPEVNEKNEALWFDFMNAVRHYIGILKKLRIDKTQSVAQATV